MTREAEGPDPVQRFQERNAYFAGLFDRQDLLWLGQNTNHLPAHPDVTQAMIACIEREEYHAYAPPLGFPELHELILADLGLAQSEAGVLVTDGAIDHQDDGTRVSGACPSEKLNLGADHADLVPSRGRGRAGSMAG